jgi:uncharacterized protein YceK
MRKNMLKQSLLILVALSGLSGCSTIYNDSASAGENGRYVTGAKNGQAAMYLCPSAVGRGDCKQINVNMK